jgi:arylsulfate sulfotransferase
MIHTKTLIALLASAAICAGPASSQVSCKVPAADVALQPTANADTGDDLIMTSFFTTAQAKGCAALTNLQGVPSWSYCALGDLMLTRAVPGGTVLLISNSSKNNNTQDYTVSEVDLAGTTINSITQASANMQLATLGKQSIIDFNHEAMRLPSGYTAIIAHDERLFTNEQGGTPQSPVDILGDEVLVLDTNWNIAWTWNAFDWLPVSRAAVLGETCSPCTNISTGHCCPVKLAPQANDWLHGNSLAYDSTDGNLIMSLRSQDWIVKIDYENGLGDGHVIWTLGNEDNLEGSPYFTMKATKIYSPWFSHQHDVELWVTYNPKELTLFDNGNTRHASNPNAVSRGQVLTIDESAMIADLHTSVDFPFYSPGYGTSQILDNGNYWWQAGGVGGKAGTDPTQSTEYVPSGASGTAVYSIRFADTAYRSFRLDAASGF